MSTECLHLIDSLTSKLLSAVSLQAHIQQSSLDAKQFGSSHNSNGYSNGYANGRANGPTGRHKLNGNWSSRHQEVSTAVNSPPRLEARKWEEFDEIVPAKCLVPSLRGGEVTINHLNCRAIWDQTC